MTKIFIVFTFFTCYVAQGAWNLNDVSYLYDLPEANEADFLLKPTVVSRKGSLFPRKVSKPIHDLVTSFYAPKDSYESLRVVGMRVDPCFEYEKDECTKQIRLIWQPTRKLDSGDITTFDAAVHAFYDLKGEEFQKLLNSLRILKNKYKVSTRKVALGIHPAIKNKKTRLSFIKDLNDIILKFAGEKNLKRFTFMKFLTKNMWWSFGGMDKDSDGEWCDMQIPRLSVNAKKQDFFNDDFYNEIGMLGVVLPNVSQQSDNLYPFVLAQKIKSDTKGQNKINKAMKAIYRIENPQVHSPRTMDCVHCHIAGPTKQWIEKKYPKMMKKASSNEDYVRSFSSRWGLKKHNLENSSLDKRSNKSLRSFGFMGAEASVNQRVVNESAHVADVLNQKLY